MLNEEKRKQLDGIVQQMVANKESDSNVRFVVEDFKKKYITPEVQAQPEKENTILDNPVTRGIQNIFPGKKLGEAIGTSVASIGRSLVGDSQGAKDIIDTQVSPKAVAGDVAQAVALPLSLGLAAPASVAGAVGQYGGLSALQGTGSTLAEGGTVGEATKEGIKSGAIGGAIGGVFNLIGKGISALANKTAPSVLSFTSGVPKTAIQQAKASPAVAKKGLEMSVPQIREKAVTSLNSLYKDLGSEFSGGLDTIKKTIPDISKSVGTEAPNAIPALQSKLINTSRNIARDFKVSFAKGGVDFSKSNIVNTGEQRVVEDAISTVQGWKDFSPQGVQDLAERIGALRKFESGTVTKGSAVVGKIYNNIAGKEGLIKTLYPELHDLRTNFATNRKVLDEIKNVLSADKNKPVQIQGAVSRLDNLFTQNKDEYVNVIKQLSERSGVDYLSLLAGGEFQKVLPDFIRGLGGGATVSVGASLINPYLLLLAPLFSPRAVGSVVRNAPAVAKTSSQLIRAGSVQAIPTITRESGSK